MKYKKATKRVTELLAKAEREKELTKNEMNEMKRLMRFIVNYDIQLMASSLVWGNAQLNSVTAQ